MYPPAPNKSMKLIVAVLTALALAAPAFADPDLILDSAFTSSSLTIATQTFAAGGCAVDEGAITPGTHRMLVFGTETANVGTSDLVVGAPKRHDPAHWQYYACHGHWHFTGYVEFHLYDLNGVEVGAGTKEGFCIEDTNPYLSTADLRAKYTCKRQGIQAGWADQYGWGLVGQWVVIDNVPAGQYTLVSTVNFTGYLPESDYSNNSIWTPVLVP